MSNQRIRRIGLMTGMEWSWPPAFIEEVARRSRASGVAVEADYVHIGAPSIDDERRYDVIVDRVSDQVPMYRTWLKHCVVSGIRVVNDPFRWTSDDKFYGASLVRSLGLATPRTVVLPNHSYPPGLHHEDSLRNLDYPLDWESVVSHVGLPVVLKDANGGGWRDVYVCHTAEELIDSYDRTARLTMIAQEFIRWDEFVRVLCVGQCEVLIMRYDPGERRHHDEPAYLPPGLVEEVENGSRRLAAALGYDLVSIEWAIRDGVPYAIDFLNAVPDLDADSLGERQFRWVVEKMAAFCIELAVGQADRPGAVATS